MEALCATISLKMAIRQFDHMDAREQKKSFLSLPREIQVQICEYYYPAWSLLIRDHMFSVSNGPSLINLPLPQSHEQMPPCPARYRGCKAGECPTRDYATIFGQKDVATYVPSINMLLVCRSIHDLARPIFEASYTKVVDADLRHYCFGNMMCWTLFIARFRKLLAQTATLHLDVSKPKEFSCAEEKDRNIGAAQYLPNFENLIVSDMFKLTNTSTLLQELGAWHWTADTPTQELAVLMGKAAAKRQDVTLIFWRIGTCLFEGYEEQDLVQSFNMIYKFQCCFEGLEGVYVSIFLILYVHHTIREC